MECEACDCTRAIKLPGKPLIQRLNLVKDGYEREREIDSTRFTDYGRLVFNRRKQREGIDALKNVVYECESSKIKPIMAGAAISGPYAIFNDGDYFRIKNIPDTHEARQILEKLGLSISNSVLSNSQKSGPKICVKNNSQPLGIPIVIYNGIGKHQSYTNPFTNVMNNGITAAATAIHSLIFCCTGSSPGIRKTSFIGSLSFSPQFVLISTSLVLILLHQRQA
jgi:hypothetical protein